jgi:hypothetical protein
MHFWESYLLIGRKNGLGWIRLLPPAARLLFLIGFIGVGDTHLLEAIE